MQEFEGFDPGIRSDCLRVLDRLRARLGENLVSLVLYGSVARGEPNEFSDYDFYVIAENLPKKPVSRIRFLRGLTFGLRLNRAHSIRGKSPDEMRDILPLFLDLAVDGVIVYDKNHFIRNFLRRVLEKIDEHKLVRYRTRDGFYGWRIDRPIKKGENVVISLEE